MDGKNLIITNGTDTIYEENTLHLLDRMCGENEFMRRDISNALNYLDERFGDENEITVDICSYIDSADRMNGMETQSIFWLATLLMQSGNLRAVPLSLHMNLIPFIADKTRVHQIKLNKLNQVKETMMRFAETYAEEQKRLQSDSSYSPDEATEKIIEVLPDRQMLEREIKERPQIIPLLKDFKELAATCADGNLTEQVNDLLEGLPV